VRPEVTLSITPRDLNIVLERLGPLAKDDLFDLIVATNVLVYYDAFEQALALANISAMLRPGGVFLTNYKSRPLRL
jgi:chemotaxis methyl-accepting protein methylase